LLTRDHAVSVIVNDFYLTYFNGFYFNLNVFYICAADVVHVGSSSAMVCYGSAMRVYIFFHGRHPIITLSAVVISCRNSNALCGCLWFAAVPGS